MSWFPDYRQVVIIRGEGQRSKNYLRSVWLGISQPIMNFPRIFLLGLTLATIQIAKASLSVFVTVAWKSILKPLTTFLCVFIAGLLGRLSVSGDDEIKGFETSNLGSGAKIKENKDETS